SGVVVAAFALTEPDAGSDAQSITTRATPMPDSYRLSGQKKWITFGQVADLFLVFARCEEQPAAFLVERGQPGLHVEPIRGVLGTRASMLAELRLEDCRIPKESLVGRVGIAQACQEACLKYAGERRQFGVHLKEHQLIQRMLTGMVVNVKAARLL